MEGPESLRKRARAHKEKCDAAQEERFENICASLNKEMQQAADCGKFSYSVDVREIYYSKHSGESPIRYSLNENEVERVMRFLENTHGFTVSDEDMYHFVISWQEKNGA